jgi:flagellar biosynthesis regulator FlaF
MNPPKKLYILIPYDDLIHINNLNNEILFQNIISVLLNIAMFLIYILNIINFITEKKINNYQKIIHISSIIFTTFIYASTFYY